MVKKISLGCALVLGVTLISLCLLSSVGMAAISARIVG